MPEPQSFTPSVNYKWTSDAEKRYEEYISYLNMSSSHSGEEQRPDEAKSEEVHVDLNESVMAYGEDGRPERVQLGRLEGSKKDKAFWDFRDFKRHETEGSILICIVTHELRSSLTSEILAPFSRINDGKMHIMEF
jgi:hypothetical protein